MAKRKGTNEQTVIYKKHTHKTEDWASRRIDYLIVRDFHTECYFNVQRILFVS
jgi:hypothetical protein